MTPGIAAHGVSKRTVCDDCGESFRNLASHINSEWTACEWHDDSDDCQETYHTRHGPVFEEAREDALDRAGWECEQCGMSDEKHKQRDDLFGGGLHVHHKVPTTEFDNPDNAHALGNLQVLCARCHGVSSGGST